MPNDLTPLEIAENLEKEASSVERFYRYYGADGIDDGYTATLRSAASYLRAIAAGEYKQVEHAHWVKVDDGVLLGGGTHTECSNCHVWRKHMYSHCPSCAAVMDANPAMGNSHNGKDDSHESD